MVFGCVGFFVFALNAGECSMTIVFTEPAGGKLVEVRLSGKLHKGDYQLFVPAVEKAITAIFTVGICLPYGKTSNSTASITRTLSALRWSVTRSGNPAWRHSASRLPAPKSAISMSRIPQRPDSGSRNLNRSDWLASVCYE
jgi:hypothetical protein